MVGLPQRYSFVRASFFVPGPAVGWKVQTLLYPLILPGSKVNINSRYLDLKGLFRVETIRHSGDTYGSEWNSQLEVTQLPLGKASVEVGVTS